MKNVTHKFIGVETINVNKRGALGEVFDCSIVYWTQSTTFMNAFIRCAMVSSRFTRQVAQYFKNRMDETAYEWRSMAKAEGFASAEVDNL